LELKLCKHFKDFNLDAFAPGTYLRCDKVKIAGLGGQRDESEIILPTFLFPSWGGGLMYERRFFSGVGILGARKGYQP